MYLRAVVCAAIAVAVPALALSASQRTPVSANAAKCEPRRPLPVTPGLAPNSTFYSDAEPPARYRTMPEGHIKVAFGRKAIDKHCGVPPCGDQFLGCIRGDLIVLPDAGHPDFAKITRHELAHFAGWPDTHGD